jgi:cation:H+ antiporter
LGVHTAIIGIACLGIVGSVEHVATALGVPVFFTAVILAAAATSVPDTILSVRDALRGNHADALSNAFGSNIFDICICLGLPLVLYATLHGELTLDHSVAAADVQLLQLWLFALSAAILLLMGLRRSLGTGTAMLLLAVYLLWAGFIVHHGLLSQAQHPAHVMATPT